MNAKMAEEGGTLGKMKIGECGRNEECLGEHFWDEYRGAHKRQVVQKLEGQMENFRFELALLIMPQQLLWDQPSFKLQNTALNYRKNYKFRAGYNKCLKVLK